MTTLERETLIQDTKTPIFNAMLEMAIEVLENFNSYCHGFVDFTNFSRIRELSGREADEQIIIFDTIAKCVAETGLMSYEDFNTLVHEKVEEKK